MTFTDRYRSAGFERNPFSIDALNERPVFVDRGLPRPPAPWSKTLVQVVGDRGYGKSAHLRQWRAEQPGPHHYIALAPYRARWTSPPRANQVTNVGTIYGDEIDRMPGPHRARWFRALARAGATVIVGTHVDLGATGRRAGFDVRTHHLKPLDRPGLEQMITAQIHQSALGELPPEVFADTDVDQILAESDGVPRKAQLICHRIFAEKIVGNVLVGGSSVS